MKQLVERRKQKIEPVRRDPAEVALEDGEKIGKYWVNLVRKDLPKHHKYFANYYKKQIQDVKRVAELCQREVRSRAVLAMSDMLCAFTVKSPSHSISASICVGLRCIVFWYGLRLEESLAGRHFSFRTS